MSTMRLEVVPEERSGEGKRSSIVRLKRYYDEPEDMEVYAPVPEVACAWLSGALTLEDANDVAICESVVCQLKCHFCYWRGRSPQSEDWTPKDVAAEFREVAADRPVWRVSGGEPTLEPLLPGLIGELLAAAQGQHVIWVTTNGYDVGRIPSSWGRVFVEISVKGLTDELYRWNSPGVEPVDWKAAIRAALALKHQVFPNVCSLVPPTWGYQQQSAAMASFCDALREIHRGLPLALTIIKPKHYEWIEGWQDGTDARDYFELWLSQQDYTPAELLTPKWMWAWKVAKEVQG